MVIDLVNPEYIARWVDPQYEVLCLNAHRDIRLYMKDRPVVLALRVAIEQITSELAAMAKASKSKKLRNKLEKAPRPPHGKNPSANLEIDYPKETRAHGSIYVDDPHSIRVEANGALRLGGDVLFVRNLAVARELAWFLGVISEELDDQQKR
jgi:hypothetical protein